MYIKMKKANVVNVQGSSSVDEGESEVAAAATSCGDSVTIMSPAKKIDDAMKRV